MNRFRMAVALVAVTSAAFAQTSDWNEQMSELHKKMQAWAKAGFKLRKSIEDKSAAGEPASLVATTSRNNPDSFAADIAIGFEKDIFSSTEPVTHSLGPMIEYHRNDNGTAPAKEQKSYAAGLSYTRTGAKPGQAAYNEIIGVSANYKNDRVKNGQGASASLFGTLKHEKSFLSHVPIATQPGQPFPWGWFPAVALQGEHADNLEAGKEAGEVYRVKGEMTLVARPFHPFPIQLTVGVVGWHNFHKDGPFARYNRDQKLLRCTFDYWLNPNLSIGITHLDGANPEVNFKGDRQTTFGIRAKF